MDDLISRQAAIDALRGYLVGKRCPDDGTLTCRLIENEVINKLPPAQPEHIRGHWICDRSWSEGVRYCRIKGKLCAFATEYGYCSFTVCREAIT